jgi:hypothetical protein
VWATCDDVCAEVSLLTFAPPPPPPPHFFHVVLQGVGEAAAAAAAALVSLNSTVPAALAQLAEQGRVASDLRNRISFRRCVRGSV